MSKFSTLQDYIAERQRTGYCYFTSAEAEQALAKSSEAIRFAVHRLKRKGDIASPYSGFHLIVPPPYQAHGCLPPDHFIPDLMEYLGYGYYVSLLSAAQYYGAAHQKPQVFQVIIDKKHRDITCGNVRINLITKKNLKSYPTQSFNTPQGTIKVATPEVTAMDMMLYPRYSAGFDNVFNVLAELTEAINKQSLANLAESTTEVTWMQRLGYLLEQLEQIELSKILLQQLSKRRVQARVLSPGEPKTNASYDAKWRLFINTSLELDI